MNNFDSIVAGAFHVAQTLALNHCNNELYPEHLLLGLIKNPSSYSSRQLKKNSSELEKKIETFPKIEGKLEIDQIKPTSKLSEWITYASGEVITTGRQEVCKRDLLKFLPKICPELNIDYSEFMHNEDEQSDVPHFLIPFGFNSPKLASAF